MITRRIENRLQLPNMKWQLLGAIIVALVFASLVPFFRPSLQKALDVNGRNILGVLSADILHNGHQIKIIKLREEGNLFLEIFAVDSTSQTLQLLQKIAVGQGHDAYVSFNGSNTNLAVDDIDEDKKLEILVPSFDQNFKARLTVLKYNEHLNQFEPSSAK